MRTYEPEEPTSTPKIVVRSTMWHELGQSVEITSKVNDTDGALYVYVGETGYADSQSSGNDNSGVDGAAASATPTASLALTAIATTCAISPDRRYCLLSAPLILAGAAHATAVHDCENETNIYVDVPVAYADRFVFSNVRESIVSATFCPGVACPDGCEIGDVTTCWSATISDDFFPYTVPRGVGTLPPSRPNQLLHLVHAASNQSVARSYDGLTWHGLPPLPYDLNCLENDGGCAMRDGHDEGDYVVISRVAEQLQTREENARLLNQATFGATQADLDAFPTSHEQWLHDQIHVVPATSLRAYLRERTNPRDNGGAGSYRSQCDIGSRWDASAFGWRDENHVLWVEHDGSTYKLYVNDVLRTESTTFGDELAALRPSVSITYPTNFTFCKIWAEGLSSRVEIGWLQQDGVDLEDSCKNAYKFNYENPPIHFSSPDMSKTQEFSLSDATFTSLSYKPETIFLSSLNVNCESKGDPHNTFLRYNNTFYRHDQRLKLIDNTIDDPAKDVNASGSLQCPTVKRNFMNAEGCYRHAGCAPLEFTSAVVSLNEINLRRWYEVSSLYPYYITGLDYEGTCSGVECEDSPCKQETYSRWIRLGSSTSCSTTSGVDAMTIETIANALRISDDTNAYVRDIVLTGENCTANQATIKMEIDVDGECYRHTHHENYGVYDFTYWSLHHPGNAVRMNAGLPNPIKQFAVEEQVNLQYPHTMSNWQETARWKIPYIGRYGDDMDFAALPTDYQTDDMAEAVDAIVSRSDDVFEVCGSAHEVGNEPTYGHLYPFPTSNANSGFFARQTEIPMNPNMAMGAVWSTNAVFAADQLRQKVSWALSQILVTSSEAIGRPTQSELWVNYYDIFTRNAFGNYRDILKEVSYSPVMGDYLTYRANKAHSVSSTFPDENYAREIMQLFSVGLWKYVLRSAPTLVFSSISNISVDNPLTK